MDEVTRTVAEREAVSAAASNPEPEPEPAPHKETWAMSSEEKDARIAQLEDRVTELIKGYVALAAATGGGEQRENGNGKGGINIQIPVSVTNARARDRGNAGSAPRSAPERLLLALRKRSRAAR